MLAVEKQHKWFKFRLREVKCATYHEMTKAANKICKEVIITRCSGSELECAFGKPVRPALFFALLRKIMKEHLRVTLGKVVPIVFSEAAAIAALFLRRRCSGLHRPFFSRFRLSSGTSECLVLPLLPLFSKERLGRQ